MQLDGIQWWLWPLRRELQSQLQGDKERMRLDDVQHGTEITPVSSTTPLYKAGH